MFLKQLGIFMVSPPKGSITCYVFFCLFFSITTSGHKMSPASLNSPLWLMSWLMSKIVVISRIMHAGTRFQTWGECNQSFFSQCIWKKLKQPSCAKLFILSFCTVKHKHPSKATIPVIKTHCGAGHVNDMCAIVKIPCCPSGWLLTRSTLLSV